MEPAVTKLFKHIAKKAQYVFCWKQGDLLLGGHKHLLVDTLNLRTYNTIGIAELVGIIWEGVHWILFYTPNSHTAVKMIRTIQQSKEDRPGIKCVFIGDMNVHNSDWICSDWTDTGGVQAQEFCELFGMRQLVDFPTRGVNTLDLAITHIDGVAVPTPGFGNSDHISMKLTFGVGDKIASTPVRRPVFNWHNAPWKHIKGELRREFADLKPEGSTHEAEKDMDTRVNTIITRHVKLKAAAKPGPTAWWDARCERAYNCKAKCFEERLTSPEQYKGAIREARNAQKKAYKKYQVKNKQRLEAMDNGDTNFWQLTKEVGGLDCEKGAVAPDAQPLATHFAEKMSNGKEIEFDEDFIPRDRVKVPFSSFRIRKKAVFKALKKMNPKESANGISPVFEVNVLS